MPRELGEPCCWKLRMRTIPIAQSAKVSHQGSRFKSSKHPNRKIIEHLFPSIHNIAVQTKGPDRYSSAIGSITTTVHRHVGLALPQEAEEEEVGLNLNRFGALIRSSLDSNPAVPGSNH